jgi:hypothetical protein
MATGDIHISVVPALSTVASYQLDNAYGNTVTSTTKSIASEPEILSLYINEQQASLSATLIQILDGKNRLTLVLKEN